MEEEIKEVVEEGVVTGVKEEESETEGNKVTGVDIYVENDPSDLDRMLGVAPSPEEGAIEEDPDKEDVDIPEEEPEVEEVKEEPGMKDRPLFLSDFMVEDKDSFSYLSHNLGSYQVQSIPLDDKKSIKQVVKSSDYIFRYPRYILKDKVLGFSVENTGNELFYCVYFPEYKLFFQVDSDYIKPYSESFKEYFEDLITRIRPRGMRIERYNSSVTINSLKVRETGVLEVSTSTGNKLLLLSNPSVSFHCILDYIRELSDQGEDTLTLKLLPEFFEEV